LLDSIQKYAIIVVDREKATELEYIRESNGEKFGTPEHDENYYAVCYNGE